VKANARKRKEDLRVVAFSEDGLRAATVNSKKRVCKLGRENGN